MQVDATVHESDAERDTGSLESRNPLTGRLELNRVREFDEFSLSKGGKLDIYGKVTMRKMFEEESRYKKEYIGLATK